MKNITLSLLLLCLTISGVAKNLVYHVSDYGLKANTSESFNNSPIFAKMIEKIKAEASQKDKISIVFDNGTYFFHAKDASSRIYYISNHDQDNPKSVGMALENLSNLTIEGNGANLMFNGRMIPISLISSKNVEIRNLSIDFVNPQIAQIQVIENSETEGITFKVAPWVKYRIAQNGHFESYGDGWTAQESIGIAFEQNTKRLVYCTSDLYYNTSGVKDLGDRMLCAPNWKDKRLVPGTVIAMRTWARPTPGIFLYDDVNTTINNVKIHYAEGMGLLAQLCENISLDGFGVCLRGNDDPRYFTTQADATHFSGCKGKIISNNGLYENMMDDAINVHGTYLKVIERKNDNTLVARYMHDQSWGFKWGDKGDVVQFLKSNTMEIIGEENSIASIKPVDKPSVDGARLFEIVFTKPLDSAIDGKMACGIENLTWTPSVEFRGNTIRNNRARGSLFSTPKKTIVENNLFDHTSGTAILLCGDCNGWYETGACKNVIIKNNRFINSLTNMFQFTNAVISIYPEIPNLKDQQKYFHGGHKGAIRIENNEFETFDNPILYAKSANGIVFKKNSIKHNSEYPAFHWNKKRFLLERVINFETDDTENK